MEGGVLRPGSHTRVWWWFDFSGEVPARFLDDLNMNGTRAAGDGGGRLDFIIG